MIDTRVCIDDTFGPFAAKVDPTHRWNGWLCPRFTLDTVREMAARSQEMADEYGHDSVPTIHVIDGGTDQGEPRVVVAQISWQYHDGDAEGATSIINPDDDGLYGIGGGEWTWLIATWLCVCGQAMHWHVTDCKNCDLTRDTQPQQTDTAAAAKEPAQTARWLADAEAAYARTQEADEARKSLAARGAALLRADRINRVLDQLGITPIVPATVPEDTTAFAPALLAEADPEEELYSVHADWDDTAGKVRLTLGHYWGENEYRGQLPGRHLNTVADVVHARREGPNSKPDCERIRPSKPTLRQIAEEAAQWLPSDVTSHDAGEITQLLSGLAAAVLCLADTVTAVNDRP
ncbi:hypothetical protein ACWCQN_38750 [Streptomyces sp. NPDC001984]